MAKFAPNGDGPHQYDVIIVGAGFAGLYMLHRLREDGYRVKCFDAGSGPGGTWHWNRYPGARCDIHSLGYSYSFSPELEQEWESSEMYAAQPEIERYANHVADRFNLRHDIQFGTRVVSGRYDEADRTWTVTTDGKQTASARYLIMATGGYSVPAMPQIPGIQTFKGEAYFTNQWPQRGVDFSGKRIGIIGTGSSGTQTATAVAAEPIKHLYVFQRTANFVVPGWNRPASAEYTREFKAGYAKFRETGPVVGQRDGISLKSESLRSYNRSDRRPRPHALQKAVGRSCGRRAFISSAACLTS